MPCSCHHQRRCLVGASSLSQPALHAPAPNTPPMAHPATLPGQCFILTSQHSWAYATGIFSAATAQVIRHCHCRCPVLVSIRCWLRLGSTWRRSFTGYARSSLLPSPSACGAGSTSAGPSAWLLTWSRPHPIRAHPFFVATTAVAESAQWASREWRYSYSQRSHQLSMVQRS